MKKHTVKLIIFFYPGTNFPKAGSGRRVSLRNNKAAQRSMAF
jgi:hypothetical protein